MSLDVSVLSWHRHCLLETMKSGPLYFDMCFLVYAFGLSILQELQSFGPLTSRKMWTYSTSSNV